MELWPAHADTRTYTNTTINKSHKVCYIIKVSEIQKRKCNLDQEGKNALKCTDMVSMGVHRQKYQTPPTSSEGETSI